MSLANQTLSLIKYPPERVAETRLINVAPGMNNFLELPLIEPYLVWFKELSFTPNANMSFIVEGQCADRQHENIIANGAVVPVLDDSLKLRVPFDYNAYLRVRNLAALVNNYQMRAVWEAHKYSVADKLAFGNALEYLEDEDQELAAKYEIVKKVNAGELPMKYPPGPLRYSFDATYSGNPVANQEVTIFDVAVEKDCKAVLRYVWSNRPAANFGSLEIRVYRERRLFLTIFPYMLANFATLTRYEPPLDLWIPATSRLRVAVWSGTGHAGITINCMGEMRNLTIFDKISWGLSLTPEERQLRDALDLEGKLKAGIYSMVTPLTTLALGRE